MSNEYPERPPMPTVRRVILLLVWPCLIGTAALGFLRAPQIAITGTFLFPIVAYVICLRVIEPWLDRRRARQHECQDGT
jgi:hypothetical protein